MIFNNEELAKSISQGLIKSLGGRKATNKETGIKVDIWSAYYAICGKGGEINSNDNSEFVPTGEYIVFIQLHHDLNEINIEYQAFLDEYDVEAI